MALTRHILLLYSFEEIYVEDYAKHAFEYSNLWAQTEGQKHQKENAGPKRRTR